MAKFSSRICSENGVLVLLLLVMGASSQDKSGEFKHDLPEGVELVDPKSLGLTDADLGKFLGNVKVLGGGQVGDTKTQILTVGFNGDESINFNDFTIPGLTDGNNTLPHKDKEIADMAFQQFKQFFQDPNKAKQFEDAQGKLNLPFLTQNHNDANKQRLHTPPDNPQNIHSQPPQLRIPMIQKPYTTPRTPFPGIASHSPDPSQNHHFLNPPLPPPRPIQQQHQQQKFHNSFNQHPPQEQHLEFGARIPTASNAQSRPTPPPSPPPPPPPPPQQQFHRQQENRFTNPSQHQVQSFQRPPNQAPPPVPQQIVQPNFPQNFQQPQRNPNQQFFNIPHTSQVRFPTNEPPMQHAQFPVGIQSPSPTIPQKQNFVQHSRFNQPSAQQNQVIRQPSQNFISSPQSQQLPPNQIIQQQFPVAPREQGKIVRNQLLLLNANSHNAPGHFYNGPSKGLTPPPPPLSYQSAHSATNQVSVQSPPPYDQSNQLPQASATATSSVYIHHHGQKASKVQHTSFHPQFRPPTRFAKDFTPIPAQSTTTIRPHSFEVTPSMTLIPLSTNENAITDPARTMQLRLYQQQKAQASNEHLTQAATPSPPTATPISITTSFPVTNDASQQLYSSSFYDFNGAQSQSQFGSQNNDLGSQVVDNEIYNNGPLSQQSQQNQQQLNFFQQQPQQQSQQQQSQQFQETNQPTVFYTQEHGRVPGHHGHPPRFQVNFSHETGKGTRFQMHPDPQNIFNNIRKKRGYRRLSNLFNRMFRWDKH